MGMAPKQNKKMRKPKSGNPKTGSANICKPRSEKRTANKPEYKGHEESLLLHEPEVSYTSRIRAIGNSKGVILNSRLLDIAGLSPETDILIQAGRGMITIEPVKETVVNTDLSTWDKQFKTAIKNGAKPDPDLFEGIKNDFDTSEW